MNRPRFAITFTSAAILLASAGCGNSTSVGGRVLYEGKAVGNGAITFLPAGGDGPTAGGMITDGHYQIEKLTPGRKIVQIVGVKKVNFAASNEEMARQAAENAKRGDTSGIVERADEIAPDAEGNNREINVLPGAQTIDFDLKRKARS